ncbi:MAG: 2-succinyl-5-enolpyruvyl-6-hydroxy-3-cyclohexene-1-carboxylic-acid synthase [Acidimicrobiia bacterium]|nr:2-succinyl-5-enolpyruvyl-6-hydroxy-3-cyclohexene-1-carboxylic-acid synthase [Acidimicrobiia bacterium]
MVGVPPPPPEDVQATYCATLVDEWIRLGVRHAILAPGSRSTPMALALAARDELRVEVVHDERVAAFVALGAGLEGDPALLLCTSGTAAANFFPAVIEAGLSEVPLIVLTADRPEELRGVGAPQTIDQHRLYGDHVRWFRDPGVADDDGRRAWRSLAREGWQHAVGGPVQLNLPFREPLLGTAGDLPAPDSPVERSSADPAAANREVPGLDRQRGVILVGGCSGVREADVAELQRMTAWPILADPASGMRHLDGVVTTADSLLRHRGFADDHAPEVVVRIGRPHASKVISQWVSRTESVVIQVGGPGVIDPDHNVSAVASISDVLVAQPAGALGTTWPVRWAHAERRADDAIARAVAAVDHLTEPGVARVVAENLPPEAVLTVASSMPVRDLEWFGGRSARAHANRGANGIDGVMSTALGRALDGAPSVVVVGDLAFVHDSNALLGLGQRSNDLRVVVVDNDGGGIFSFLPQATALDTANFELLFGTPLGTDVVRLAAAHGLAARTVTSPAELAAQLAVQGPWVVRVPSERTRNVAVHDELHSAVAAVLG